jgi:hypothetical protein
MDKKFYISIVAGLVLVGVLMALAEYLSSMLGCSGSQSSEKDSGFFSKKRGRFLAGAKVIFCVAAFMGITLALMPDFEQFPSGESISRFVDITLSRADLPWGNISILAACLGFGISIFLIFAGIEHWRRRRAYVRACLCFALGFVICLQALFQWD